MFSLLSFAIPPVSVLFCETIPGYCTRWLGSARIDRDLAPLPLSVLFPFISQGKIAIDFFYFCVARLPHAGSHWSRGFVDSDGVKTNDKTTGSDVGNRAKEKKKSTCGCGIFRKWMNKVYPFAFCPSPCERIIVVVFFVLTMD